MPIYEFKCKDCELTFEKSLKIADSASASCPLCHKVTTHKLPPKGVLSKVGEVKSIPKELDLAVGKSAEERWLAYEERNKEKEKIRKNSETNLITRDSEGNYSSLAIQKDGERVIDKEALKIRREMYDTMDTIKKDSSTKKFVKEN